MNSQQIDVAYTKAELRQLARARLNGLSPARRRTGSERITAKCMTIPALRDAQTLFVYVSTASEVDTHGLIDFWLAAKKTVLIPYLRNKSAMDAVRFPGWSAMTSGALGILSPPPAAAYAGRIDGVVVPALAFSPDGARLGHGAGYYDRWFAANGDVPAVGLGFEAQLFDAIPVDLHDVLVPHLVTESRTIKHLRAKRIQY